MFEIIFDSLRDDFTQEDLENCYIRNKAILEEVVGSNCICFSKNVKVDIIRILESEDFQDLYQLTFSFSDAFTESYGHCRILIAVERISIVARICIERDPLAKWGAVFGSIGFVYGPVTDELILHETLHIFGADDCYKSNDEGFHDSTCGHTNCIMQYAPSKAKLKSQEWICEPNVRKIRNFLKSCH